MSGARGLLVVLVGAPGTGKSTLARRLAPALGAQLIQTDQVRKLLFAEPRYTGGESGAVYGWCHNLIGVGLRTGRAVVFDGTNLEERNRRRLYDLADEHHARLLLVWTAAPPAVVQQRLLRRHAAPSLDDLSDADWPIYLRLRATADPISRPHLVVNTTADLEPIVGRLRTLAAADAPDPAERSGAPTR